MPMKGLILFSFPLEIKREQNKFATRMLQRTKAGIKKKKAPKGFLSSKPPTGFATTIGVI